MDSSTPRTVAFFDFDGTLYNGHIWQDLARHHWAAKLHRRWVMAYVTYNMVPFPLYKLGLLSQIDFYRSWGETMAWLVRGWPVDEALDLFECLTIEQVMPNLHIQVVDLVHQHQSQGHLVALISGLFTPWLKMVAQRLGVSHAIGTPMEVCDGHYTGRTLRPLCQGPGKPERAEAYFNQLGQGINWATSFAYGDSGTDTALLSLVGQPVAVYPDEKLQAEAKVRGWPVLEEASL